jgi:large subunit ribosomal protein L22
MPGPKTNEREGTRAVLHYALVSPYKLRQVIDAIRNKPVHEALDLLRFLERSSATIVAKVLQSAVANAVNNDGQQADELFVSACYVDEGPTQKRWRPRARGRATRIRKRSAHVTVIVSRLPEERLERLQARRRAENLAMRSRRVEATRRASAESAEGQSRRERRHPEAFPAPEETAVTEDAAVGEDAAVTEEAAGAEGLAAEDADVDEADVSEDADVTEDAPAAEDAAAQDAVVAEDAPDEPDSRGGEQEKDS